MSGVLHVLLDLSLLSPSSRIAERGFEHVVVCYDKEPHVDLPVLSSTDAVIHTYNGLAENAGWDRELVAQELGDPPELGVDLGEIIFVGAELDALLSLTRPQ